MDLSTLKGSIDLVAVVEGAGTELKRFGRLHKGLCPLHSDTEPSFVVYPDQHFRCFGCQEHGDVFDFIQKLHGCDFKQALGILGIKQGKLTTEKREEIKRLQHRRELVKAFRKWEIDAADEAAMLCRCCRKVLGEIKTTAHMDKYGNRYHDLETYAYHLDVLVGDDDQAKIGLYDAGYYG